MFKAKDIGSAYYGQSNNYSVSGDKKISTSQEKDQIIYSFWTPSPDTKKNKALVKEYFGGDENNIPSSYDEILADNAGKKDKKIFPKKYWVDDDETQVKQFANMLKTMGAQGLHYTLVTGIGTTGLKKGYFWEVTVDKGIIPIETLILLYSNFWERESNIYLRKEITKSTYRNS